MFNRIAPFAGAIAIMVGLLAGCQDSPTTSPDSSSIYTVQDNEAYKAFELSSTPLNDFSEVPSVDEAMGDALVLLPPPPPPDSLHRGPGDRDSLRKDRPHPDSLRKDRPNPDSLRKDRPHPDSLRKDRPNPDSLRKDRPNPDSLRKHPPHPDSLRGRRPDTLRHRPGIDSLVKDHRVPVDYSRIIKQLNLTPEQDSLIRLCFAEFRQCTDDATARYRTARQEAFQSYQQQITEIRRKLAAKEITLDEARAQVNALNRTYRQQVGGMETAYRAAMESCRNAFESCVESHLTAEQLALWERLTSR